MADSTIDWSDYTGAVVTCPLCEWRAIATSKRQAWYLQAMHLKAHGDYRAAGRAWRNMRNNTSF